MLFVSEERSLEQYKTIFVPAEFHNTSVLSRRCSLILVDTLMRILTRDLSFSTYSYKHEQNNGIVGELTNITQYSVIFENVSKDVRSCM